MKAVCVYCGSSPGDDPAFADAARSMGALLARTGRTLVYGGGRVGLMGILADAALAAGGRVVGVIPRALAELEVAHVGLSDLRIVDSMHQRKALLAEMSDGFVALPGGFGTLDELFEALTWAQLGIHSKPIGLLDAGGFFAPLLAFLDGVAAARLVRPEHRALLLAGNDPAVLLARMEAFRAAPLAKWLDRPQP